MTHTITRRNATRNARRARRARATTVRQRFVRLAADHARTQPDPAPGVRGAATPATITRAAVAADKPDSTPESTPGGHTLTATGEGEHWHGTCSCGNWATSRAMKREASVKGAHTRHVNAAE